jgi:hypothetical protein
MLTTVAHRGLAGPRVCIVYCARDLYFLAIASFVKDASTCLLRQAKIPGNERPAAAPLGQLLPRELFYSFTLGVVKMVTTYAGARGAGLGVVAVHHCYKRAPR